ncbi:hypothetical protein DFH08DRAFT_28470 [Mycena albidolilacea]|uniref:Uncharacterized protein n=1 Tax=Mycena albidolilacea TaxID=1033008 RepID=A0AAD7AVG1_9AGAR|nr:hypothetical protein DFH08DRAFT_28470 [Mycena albidolilacea]
MLLLRLLPIGLLALLVASQVDDQYPDDVLNNKHGKTPCEMQDMFLNSSSCSLQARDDNDGDMTITPSRCTCTNVFFNLWSACVYTKTHLNQSLPPCESFQQKCVQASIDVTTNAPQSDTMYPGWVFMELPPANGTFSLVGAVESADGLQPRNWTTIQIVVPILVGLAVGVAGVFLGFFIYRRRRNANRERPWMQTTGNRPRFQFPTWSSRQKVRELNRSTSWSIDQGEEELQEYQFVSYPASLQGSRASGHVRLSSSSSIQAGPPPLKIPSDQKPPVWTWPGKSIWKGPLQSARQLGDSIPRPWRSTKRVNVKNIPGYNKFRVDGADSDSPLSQRPHTESLLGHTGRSRTNLHQETIFEGENDDDSDSDEEALPFIPQEHSRSNHDAEPPTNAVLYISPASGTGRESPGDSNGSRIPRQIPPAGAPPSIPLPLLPPVPTQRPQPPPPPALTSSQQPPVATQVSKSVRLLSRCHIPSARDLLPVVCLRQLPQLPRQWVKINVRPLLSPLLRHPLLHLGPPSPNGLLDLLVLHSPPNTPTHNPSRRRPFFPLPRQIIPLLLPQPDAGLIATGAALSGPCP